MTEFDPEKKKQVAENLSSLRHPRGLHDLLLTDEEFEILDVIQTLRQKSSPEGATFL